MKDLMLWLAVVAISASQQWELMCVLIVCVLMTRNEA
jgi:hypothetical protein